MDQAYCDALRFAIQTEESGQKFYRQSVPKVKDAFAKKALEFLAEEEAEHGRKIEEFNKSLLGQSQFDMEKECGTGLPERIGELVKEYVSDTTKEMRGDSNDIEVYDMALDIEKRHYEMYKSNARNENPELRRFFEFMAGEESQHYNLIAMTKRYLEDPSIYFEDYGGWIFG